MKQVIFESVNPYNNSPLETYECLTDQQLHNNIGASTAAFSHWKKTSITGRQKLLAQLAEHLRKNSGELAELITSEMGKLISEARGEIEKCAWVCDYYAENGEEFLRQEAITTEAKESYIRYDSIGIVFGIMPWNFPFWQVFRFAVPTILAGNTVLIKHAPNVTGCGLAIERSFRESGFPENIFQNLVITHEQAAKTIAHPDVKGVTLTGSERAGREIGALAGQNLKKCVLELGGSDPFIVFPDADIKLAARTGAQSRLLNAGQTCISAKRFILHADIHDEFIDHYLDYTKGLRSGDPMDESTGMAPLARQDLTENLKAQMDRAIGAGSTLLYGGQTEGCYFQPTVLTNVNTAMSVACEETFGPLATIFPVKNIKEALWTANETNYGLGASVWTTSQETVQEMAENLDVGNVFINSLVKSDPRLPFGGTKQSGFGRELSWHGAREFTNIKTVFHIST